MTNILIYKKLGAVTTKMTERTTEQQARELRERDEQSP